MRSSRTVGTMMESGFVFPILSPVVIAEQLSQYGIAPVANLRPENIANPQPDLLPGVLARFFDSFVDAPGDGEDGLLRFSDLEVLDNPEHHAEAIRALHLYIKSQAFLDSIKFKDFTLADFTRPTPDRVVVVLSALVNFLLYREEKLQKEITDHELAAQMEEPMAQQLEADVNALQQKVQVYNKQQLNLRAKAAAINDKKEEIHRKITQADFELTKHAQENSRLMSKLVKSPEKVKRVLEEKKSARAKLKESEKIAMQNDQEKSAALEIRNKAHEKLTKQHSKVQHVHEQLVAAKTVEKEVKARKAKLNDESVSVMSFDALIVDWQGKVHEMEERLKGKVEERNQITADENQKLGALSSEIEGKLCLELREKKVEAMIAKAWCLCREAASVKTASMAEQQKSRAEFDNIVKEYNAYMDSFNPFLEQVEEAVR
ncbi:hypothetical protein ZWY2020_054781 [Hordeum vulgare]|nr:hypothetical protein ZWY2020_054781 [Hordeum vulgare]